MRVTLHSPSVQEETGRVVVGEVHPDSEPEKLTLKAYDVIDPSIPSDMLNLSSYKLREWQCTP